ncbi:hypothetical protein C1645_838857 [Glomus cerebriforme]|uniref:Uncharacterized protein n=1 Tax=Glomus cerebriforme TaxID=658196 RepID=A0A397S1M6_9GLOM|nr:hypothetical protein C1645_838857 [Glomus cerebriforme]
MANTQSKINLLEEQNSKLVAEASVRMESSLCRKRKANKIDCEQDVDKVFGIVITDASEWYFMEFTLDKGGKAIVYVVKTGSRCL